MQSRLVGATLLSMFPLFNKEIVKFHVPDVNVKSKFEIGGLQMEQLAFFREITNEEYKLIQKEVAKELFSYRVLRVRMQNQEECSNQNISLFPELRDTKKINDYKYIQIKRALEHALDPEQREIIERKYLRNGMTSDKNVKAQMFLENNWFYAQKKNAIMAIATALRII